MVYVPVFIVFFVECFGVILKGVKFGFDYSSIKRVLACFFVFFGKLPTERQMLEQTFVDVLCFSSRFCCFGLDLCASALLWAEILVDGSSGIKLRFA